MYMWEQIGKAHNSLHEQANGMQYMSILLTCKCYNFPRLCLCSCATVLPGTFTQEIIHMHFVRALTHCPAHYLTLNTATLYDSQYCIWKTLDPQKCYFFESIGDCNFSQSTGTFFDPVKVSKTALDVHHGLLAMVQPDSAQGGLLKSNLAPVIPNHSSA